MGVGGEQAKWAELEAKARGKGQRPGVGGKGGASGASGGGGHALEPFKVSHLIESREAKGQRPVKLGATIKGEARKTRWP